MPPELDDPWLLVGRRGRARPAPSPHTPRIALARETEAEEESGPVPAPPPTRSPPLEPTDPAAARLAAAVAATEATLVSTGWWAGLVRALGTVTRAAEGEGGGTEGGGAGAPPPRPPFSCAAAAGLLLLGLGSLEAATGPSPRSQAALACLLARHVEQAAGGRRPRLVAADPAFTSADEAALTSLGFEVLPPASALAAFSAAVSPASPWVAYLPHCEAGLTEAVLKACGGGGGGNAPPIALLGNSLAALAGRWSCALPNGRGGRATVVDPHGGGRPDRALGLVGEGRAVEAGLVPVGGGEQSRRRSSTLAAAFGDTALHLFLPART